MEMDWEWFKEDGVWIVVTLAISACLLWAMQHWVPRWITRLVNRLSPPEADWSRGARVTRRAVYWVGSIIIVAVTVIVVLPHAGVEIDSATNELKDTGNGIVDWLAGSGVRVVLILLVAFALQQIARGIIPSMIHRSVVRKEIKRERLLEEAEQRADTLSGFLVGVVIVIIWIVAVFMLLPEFKVNIAPLLAGAGIVGIAIGFGAQGLIRDIIAGIFIIMEDQYAKGDWIQVGGIDGEVEYIGLRRTVLRDFNGTHHNIPNGEIKISSNLSKDFACVNMDIPVAYGEDMDHVIEVLNRVSREMAAEERWGQLIIETPQVLRVNNFGESGIDIKLWGKTKPIWQWAVSGELRKRIKKTFDNEGIEIPWPHVKLYFGNQLPSITGTGKEAGEEKNA